MTSKPKKSEILRDENTSADLKAMLYLSPFQSFSRKKYVMLGSPPSAIQKVPIKMLCHMVLILLYPCLVLTPSAS